jgi:hypothetical protein
MRLASSNFFTTETPGVPLISSPSHRLRMTGVLPEVFFDKTMSFPLYLQLSKNFGVLCYTLREVVIITDVFIFGF